MSNQYKKVALFGTVPSKTVHAMGFTAGKTVGFVLAARAFCGAASGYRGSEWHIYDDADVNCWKCLIKLKDNLNL